MMFEERMVRLVDQVPNLSCMKEFVANRICGSIVEAVKENKQCLAEAASDGSSSQ